MQSIQSVLCSELTHIMQDISVVTKSSSSSSNNKRHVSDYKCNFIPYHSHTTKLKITSQATSIGSVLG